MSLISLFTLALLLQGGGPTVMLSVDRDHVAPGDLVILTIRAVSNSPDAIRVELPALGGFELESRAERSEVTPGSPGGGKRTTVVELRLRAVTPGEWRLGPIAARQGIAFGVADPVTVTILGGGVPAVATGLSPRVAKLLERAPPPPGLDEAGVTVVLPDTTVTTGAQVDVVSVAWFERELRQRLRRAASLEPPALEGMWSYTQPVAVGIAATRVVNGRTYDLFIRHQVAFPLGPGILNIPAAKLGYTVPLSYQFFSQEERFELSSQPARLIVVEPPAEGRDPGFAGAVGQDLAISVRLDPAVARQRDAVTATVELRGSGNVALWPQPALPWPGGVRVYAEGSEERSRLAEGWLSGTKRFRYLLIPDSAGTLSIPPLRYPYFDPVRSRYQLAAADGVNLIVSPGTQASVARAEPPPVRLTDRIPVAGRLRGALPPVAWWGLLMVGPLLGLLRHPRKRRTRPMPRAAPPADAIQASEHRLHARVQAILGVVADPWATASQLHDAGVPRDTADRVGSLLDRFRAARFSATPGDIAELLRDTELVLKRLQGTTARRGRSLRRRLTLLLLFALSPALLKGQTSPLELYQAGAYRLAAQGFARDVLARPESADRWYNLGAARYRAGRDAAALAAWVVAARLAPRDRNIRRALALVPPAANVPAAELWTSPLTPDELWLIAVVAWVIAWGAIARERRLRGRWLVLVAGALLLFASAEGLRRWYGRPLAVAQASQVLRLAPHERAPGVGELALLDVVHPLGERHGWVLMESAGGQRGWVPWADLIRITSPGRP